MLSFKSTVHHTRTRFLTKHAVELLSSIIFFGAIYYLGYFKKEFPLLISVVLILFILDFIDRSTRTYINEITIDATKREVAFYCFQFWKGAKVNTRSFDELKIKIVTPKPRWLFNSTSIYFFKEKPTDFYVSAKKDDFTKETISKLVSTLTEFTKLVV